MMESAYKVYQANLVYSAGMHNDSVHNDSVRNAREHGEYTSDLLYQCNFLGLNSGIRCKT